MAKLSDHGRVEQKDGEVEIIFNPDVPFPLVKEMVDGCANGSCNCGCDQIISSLDRITTEDGADGAIIHLKGSRVKAEEVEKHFFECDQQLPLEKK